MTDDTTLARLEIDFFEERNAALRELVDADDTLNHALVDSFPPGPVVDAVCRGLDDWSAVFAVLRRVGAAGGVPTAHPVHERLLSAGKAVDAAVAALPDGPERDALVFALSAWTEANRRVATFRHVPPSAWWKDE